MAVLNRYVVRLQQFRQISIDALNAQHARSLAEEDALAVGDAELAQAQSATKVQDNVGQENGQPLHRYDVRVRFRRNIIIDAVDKQEAREYARSDADALGDADQVQPQTISFLKEKTGIVL